MATSNGPPILEESFFEESSLEDSSATVSSPGFAERPLPGFAAMCVSVKLGGCGHRRRAGRSLVARSEFESEFEDVRLQVLRHAREHFAAVGCYEDVVFKAHAADAGKI